MKTLCSLLCMLLSFYILVGQQDIPSISDNFFCKPGVVNSSPGKGVVLEYGLLPKAFLNVDDDDEDEFGGTNKLADEVSNLKVKLKIPLWHKPDLTILLGFEHERERHQLDLATDKNNVLLQTLDNRLLKISRGALYVVKPLNEKYYLGFRAGASFNGDYDGLVDTDKRYAIYRVVGLLGWKKRDDLEFGVGAMYNNSFQKTAVYPFLMYNQTFNDKWGIESILPINIKVRRNFNEGSMLLFGAEYSSNVFSMNVETADMPRVFNFKNSGIDASAEWQQQVASWVWFSARAGYHYSFDATFENAKTGKEHSISPAGGLFGVVGVFLSPPQKANELDKEKKF